MVFSSVSPEILAAVVVRTFVLSLAILGISFAIRRRSAAIQHAVWAAGFVGCLTMPVIVAVSPTWSLKLLPSGVGTPSKMSSRETVRQQAPSTALLSQSIDGELDAVGLKASTIGQHAGERREVQAAELDMEARGASTAPPAPNTRQSLGSVAMTIWGVGSCVYLVQLIYQILAVRHKLRRSTLLVSSNWCSQLELAAHRMGVRTKVGLKRHSGSISPMVVGWLNPTIVLPVDAEAWSNERRSLVLLHELAHVRRYDVLTQTMARLACAINWFNPVCWYGLAQMRRLREMACDDLVLNTGQQATEYADALLSIARQYRHRRYSTAVGMAHTTNVEHRILAILDKARTRASLTGRSLRTCAVFATVLVLVIGSLRLQSRAEPTIPPDPAGGNSGTDEAGLVEAQEVVAEADGDSRRMAILIRDENGEPLTDAKIYVGVWYVEGYEGEKVPKEHFTDSHGRVEFNLPRRLKILRLWPSKPGYVPLFLNFAEGKHEEGLLIPEEYEFKLKKGRRLSGRIVDEEGIPVTNATVQVKVEVDEPAWGKNPDPMISTWLTDSDFNSPAPLTDSNGHWSIVNAPASPEEGEKDFEFRLQVTHPEFAGDTRWGELQQKQGITTEKLRSGEANLILKRGLQVSGSVVGPDGKPITKGWVVWSDEPYFNEGVLEGEINADGTFLTPPLHPGEHPITIIAPGYAAQRRLVQAGRDSRNLRFQLKPGKPLEIRIVDSAGNPVPDASVYLANTSEPDTWNGSNALHNHKHPNVPDYGIPRAADKKGVFQWDWAPEETVKYSIGARGFASQDVSLVAKSEPHVVTLPSARVVTGMVTDSVTGEPVKSFQAMPVIVFRPDFFHTRITDAKVGSDGKYDLPLTGSGDPNSHYRVRFEADGYRSVVSDKSFGPLDGRATLNFQLEPAAIRKGWIVDANGDPVGNVTILESSPTDVSETSNGKPDSGDSRPITTDAEGNFQLHGTTEPVRVRAYHDLGFAEKALAPSDEEIGELQLQPWAKVSGRLLQAGKPVPNETVYFYPLAKHGLTEARFQDSYYAQTDVDGHFEFDRIPPISGSLKASLGPWRDSPLTSSESAPLDLHPGQQQEVNLGGDGATVTGRVIATGRNNDDLSKQWSLNYLVSRDGGVEYLKDAEPLSLAPSGALQPAWLRQPDFETWIATRRNHFVKLSDDGQLRVHGVKPGEYDLVIRLYEQPAGCLVETIGEKIVPVTVSSSQSADHDLKIGDIEVPCLSGPRVGSDMRAFQFTDSSGRGRHIDDMKGRYVLLHAWATWCSPCLESMPKLKEAAERYATSPLTVIGLNVDEDAGAAEAFAERERMVWAQNYLGANSDLMRQLAVSSVPVYYLIGPDGKLIGSANQFDEIEKLLSTALK